jgi:hypothetical protein
MVRTEEDWLAIVVRARTTIAEIERGEPVALMGAVNTIARLWRAANEETEDEFLDRLGHSTLEYGPSSAEPADRRARAIAVGAWPARTRRMPSSWPRSISRTRIRKTRSRPRFGPACFEANKTTPLCSSHDKTLSGLFHGWRSPPWAPSPPCMPRRGMDTKLWPPSRLRPASRP